jgi:hypothetical protein
MSDDAFATTHRTVVLAAERSSQCSTSLMARARFLQTKPCKQHCLNSHVQRSRRGTIESAMKTKHGFFLLVVPVLWGTGSLIHFHFPGDEYALWVFGSMAGSWVSLLLPNVGDIHQWWIGFSVAGVGTLVMALAGWILCWLKVRKRIWIGLWAVGAVAWLGFMMSRFTSLEQALAKNGSWWAYLFFAAMMAAYSATLVALTGGGIKLLMREFPKSVASSSGSHSAAPSR